MIAPLATLPPGAADCHMHVIGPFDRFPLAAERAYTVPEATLEEHDAMKRRAGLERTVFVQHAILAGNPARLYGFPSA